MNTQWSMVALTVLSLTGGGLFTAAAIGCLMGKGGEIRRPSFIVSAAFLAAAFIATALMIGNPSRVFNILEHITSGFSMAMVGSFVLAAVALYAAVTVGKSENGLALKVACIVGVVLTVAIVIGVAKIYMRPARPALDHLSVALYLAAYAFSVGLIGLTALSSVRSEKLKLLSLGAQVVAIVWFVVNVSMLGTRDWAININELVSGAYSLYLYLFVIAAGLILPFISEAASKKMSDMRSVLSAVSFTGVVVGCMGFAAILNSTIGYIRKLL